MSFLTWLQSTAVAQWVSGSLSLLAYPTILTLHTVGLAMLVGSNAAIDLRLLGVGKRVPVGELGFLARPLWLGFFINAVSGSLLFAADAVHKAHQTVFYVKLGFIFSAIVVFILTRPFVTRQVAGEKIPGKAKTLAIISLILWIGAITAGRLMAYF